MLNANLPFWLERLINAGVCCLRDFCDEPIFTPHAGEGGLNFLLEARNQFAVGGDQCLLGFDLGDDARLAKDCGDAVVMSLDDQIENAWVVIASNAKNW